MNSSLAQGVTLPLDTYDGSDSIENPIHKKDGDLGKQVFELPHYMLKTSTENARLDSVPKDSFDDPDTEKHVLSSAAFVEVAVDNENFVLEVPSSKSNSKNVRTVVLQKWEGLVLSVDRENMDFTCILRDKTDCLNTDEEAVIDMSAVSESDLGLLRDGAVFYWTIGYSFLGKTRKNVSEIHFSRLRNFTPAFLKKADDYGRKLEAVLSGGS